MKGKGLLSGTGGLSGIGEDKGLDLVKVSNQTPAKTDYTDPEPFITEADIANGITHRFIFDLTGSGYKEAGIQYKIFADTVNDTVVMTTWITNNDDADDAADTDWIDVSATVLGGANVTVNNTTTNGFKWFNAITPADRAMIKLVYTYGGGASANNSVDVYLNRTN